MFSRLFSLANVTAAAARQPLRLSHNRIITIRFFGQVANVLSARGVPQPILKYTGETQNDKMHGNGKVIFHNGAVWEGKPIMCMLGTYILFYDMYDLQHYSQKVSGIKEN